MNRIFLLANVSAVSLFFLKTGCPAYGQTPHPAFPVGSITAYPTLVQTGTKPTLTWSILLPDGENPEDYLHFIRQILVPSGVTYDTVVSTSGQMLSPLSIDPGAARFELWTVSSTTLNATLLDSTTGGPYLPIATLTIRSDDPYPYLPRTRADRPFWVDIDVQGLLSDPQLPESSKSLTFLRHGQSYGLAGTGTDIDRAQATPLLQFSITTNGSSSLVIDAHAIPGDEGPYARGEERFTLMTVEDYQYPPYVLKSRSIQVWPVARAVISGVTEGQNIGPVVPDISIELNDLYPSSNTFAQVYQGSPQPGAKGRVVPNTTFAVNSAIPQNRTTIITNYLPLFDSDGLWTLEIVTETPFGTEPVAAVTFNVRGTATIREAWRLLHFGITANSGDGADMNDFDLDGLPNIIEFALGLNPKLADSGSMPAAQIVDDELVIDFNQPAGVGGIRYHAEWSSDLQSGSWTLLQNSAAPPRQMFRLSRAGHPTAFMRLRVVGQ